MIDHPLRWLGGINPIVCLLFLHLSVNEIVQISRPEILRSSLDKVCIIYNDLPILT